MTDVLLTEEAALAAELERWFDSAVTIERSWIDFQNEARNILHIISPRPLTEPPQLINPEEIASCTVLQMYAGPTKGQPQDVVERMQIAYTEATKSSCNRKGMLAAIAAMPLRTPKGVGGEVTGAAPTDTLNQATKRGFARLYAVASDLATSKGFTSRHPEDHKQKMPRWVFDALNRDADRRTMLANGIAKGIEEVKTKGPSEVLGDLDSLAEVIRQTINKHSTLGSGYFGLSREIAKAVKTQPARESIEDWKPIRSAPRDGTPILIQTCKGYSFPVKWEQNMALDKEGESCGAWLSVIEGFRPPCWTDDQCWAANENEEVSDQPIAWKPLSSTEERQS